MAALIDHADQPNPIANCADTHLCSSLAEPAGDHVGARLVPHCGKGVPGVRALIYRCLTQVQVCRIQGWGGMPSVHPSGMRPVYFVEHPPGPYPHPSPRVVLGKNFVFITLAAVICRKHSILRYLKPRYLKTKNLS